MSILDEVKQRVEAMGEEDVRLELQKLVAAGAKRKESQAKRNADPAAKEKRQEYSKTYREQLMADPEKAAKVIERRKEYHSRPEVKEKMKSYRTRRNEQTRAILARAKELGIEIPSATA